MQSSNHVYLAKIDHLRAFAAFSVFCFHFTHNSTQCHIICGDLVFPPPLPPFTILDQGYTGVSLFMCITGYIFSYLTYGKNIQPAKLLWNRILRLAPLLIFWQVIIALFYSFTPTTGTWSITVEFEFYAILPILLLYIRAYGPVVPIFSTLFLCIAFRVEEQWRTGDISQLAYYSIIGRADQLLLGLLAFHMERMIKTLANARRIFNLLGVMGMVGLCGFYYDMALDGGLLRISLKSTLFYFMPTCDGVFHCCLLLWYLQQPVPQLFSRIFSALGRWSYSIYLNHFLLAPIIITTLGAKLHLIPNFYVHLLFACVIGLPIVLCVSALTYHFIERPFLKWRMHYLLD